MTEQIASKVKIGENKLKFFSAQLSLIGSKLWLYWVKIITRLSWVLIMAKFGLDWVKIMASFFLDCE